MSYKLHRFNGNEEMKGAVCGARLKKPALLCKDWLYVTCKNCLKRASREILQARDKALSERSARSGLSVEQRYE